MFLAIWALCGPSDQQWCILCTRMMFEWTVQVHSSGVLMAAHDRELQAS